MTFASPFFNIPRQGILHMEAMFVKMWDPPKESPSTPDRVEPTNPVPEVMAMAGYQNPPSRSHTLQRDLLHGLKMSTWDSAKELVFMTFRDGDNPSTHDGNWPGPTIRVPRGVVFHCDTQGHGPPPHTIHWHGIEPTPMNDGVGHCSMELGQYTYQWQPNFIGTYFYHCHRNTVQHFEFGLYGMLFIEPPDAYFATLQNPSIPIGHCRDGKRRTAANLADFPQFPGWNSNLLTEADPLGQYLTNPHAMTVPYDVEALWVLDDRDSVWSDLAPDARATYPKLGDIPGYEVDFHGNAGGGVGPGKFFAFNDFNADYWFVTGVPVPAHRGGSAAIPDDIVVPPALNSGVSGMQVPINAQVGQTVLLRLLDAAYNCLEITFPIDIVIIAWDGRALGVPPYGMNHAYSVPAYTPMHISTARRFDALIRSDSEVHDFATVKFIDTRGQVPGIPETVLCTALVPINIGAGPGGGAFAVSGAVITASGAPVAGVTLSLSGGAIRTTITDSAGSYEFAGVPNGDYIVSPAFPYASFSPASASVPVGGASLSGVNFVASVALSGSAISGSVFDRRSAQALPGMQMDLIGPDGSTTTVISDAFGNYRFAGLADGRYTVIPFHPDYRFSPRERDVRLAGANATDQYFEARRV
ncbi:MAG: carboxypeptidase regulatory-like domain-containing protein [Chloroflexi bacterium]|nr:carboxypeptidase regulatory-like domain-containing protein [Chloroflexota bacterium]